MGGAQSTKNLYDCLQLLIQDDLSPHIIEKLKKLYGGPLPKINENIKEILEFLRKPVLTPLPYIEDCNLISTFQYCVLIPQNPKDQKYFTDSFLKNFRLMNFSTQQKYKEEDEQSMMLIFKGLNNYCNMSKTLLKFVDQILWWDVYVLLWEHFWMHLPILNTIYPFSHINHAFNTKYPNFQHLNLEFKAETLGAKLWGNTIPIDVKFLLEQFFLSRDTCKQDLPYSKIFNCLLDLWIDQYNIQFIGFSGTKYNESLTEMIQKINENSQSICQVCVTDQKHLRDYLEYLMNDYLYLQNVFPEWFLENHLCETIFQNCEERIKQQILQYSEREQKQLIKEFLQTSCILDSEVMVFSDDFSSLINFDRKPQQSILRILVNDLFKQNSIFESQKTNITTDSHQQVNSQIIEDIEQEPQQIGEQVTSDYFGSSISKKSAVLHPPITINELKDICNHYDQFKFPIVNRCAARDNNVQYRNHKRLKLPDKLHSIFDFSHKTTTQDIVELTTYLSKQQLDYHSFVLDMADLLFK